MLAKKGKRMNILSKAQSIGARYCAYGVVIFIVTQVLDVLVFHMNGAANAGIIGTIMGCLVMDASRVAYESGKKDGSGTAKTDPK